MDIKENQKKILILQKLNENLKLLNFNDKDAIIKIGAEFEESYSSVFEAELSLKGYFEICFEAMKAIYEDSAKSPKEIIKNISKILDISIAVLNNMDVPVSELDGIKGVIAGLLRSNEKEMQIKNTENSVLAGKESSNLCIDDISLLLIQLKPDNKDSVQKLCKSIDQLISCNIYSEDINKKLTDIKQKIIRIIDEKIEKKQEIIGEVEKTIGDIQEMLEPDNNIKQKPKDAVKSDVNKKNNSLSSDPENNKQTFVLPADADIATLEEFINECSEYIENSETALLNLESNPEDQESLNIVFRAFHTIKGTSAFLGLPQISEFAHHAETLLSRIRDHEIIFSSKYADLALRSLDMIKNLIQFVHDAIGGEEKIIPGEYYTLFDILTNPEKVKSESDNKSKSNKTNIPEANNIANQKSQKVESAANKKNNSQLSVPENNKQTFTLPADADIGTLEEFINESNEYIENSEAALLNLESNPEDQESLNIVFRAFHTIKGTSAFLGLKLINEFAHHAETLLSRIRDHQIVYSGKYADLALRSLDMIKNLIQFVHDAIGGEEKIIPGEYYALLDILTNPEKIESELEPESDTINTSLRLGDIMVADGKASREDIELAAFCQGKEPLGKVIIKSNVASVKDVATSLRKLKKINGEEVSSFVKVNTDKMDKLLDMVGELVIAHSMISQDKIIAVNHGLAKKVAHTGKIVRELQDLSMTIRMVPLKSTLQKMNRLVRDLSQKSNKVVNLIIEGEGTEIDRNMVDVLNDPLVHLIRNAVDHGIEDPESRKKSGKKESGTIHLSALNLSGKVVVNISDDGKGLDHEKIVKKAIEKGLIESNKNLSESEIFKLIFLPGFSTADKITDISGRGVGLDVVKKGVDSLRGQVDVTSEKGKGTVFSIHLPLTLAITDGMLIKVGKECFIIPAINIIMSLRPDADSVSSVMGRGEIVKIRNEFVPIFRLNKLFDIPDAVNDLDKALLLLMSDKKGYYALLVDELLGQQQVVAKSLSEGIGKVDGISGAAILADGCVGLILDPDGIGNMARDEGFSKNTLQFV